ncbi:MAG: DUF488 domain-containing protein, partial [Micromonosporaceae bacterium]
MATKPNVQVRRVYEDATQQDGARVLVDRVWPRGLTKDKAALDEWRKDVAPSTSLRKWYGHDSERFDEFRRRYRDELEHPDQQKALQDLRQLAADGRLTLLTATKDPSISAATVLADLL